MSSRDNVIDMQKHRESRGLFEETAETKLEKSLRELSFSGVTDISVARQQILEEEKRSVKRTILTEFVALHVVIPNHGLTKSVLINISEDGMAFSVPKELGKFAKGESIAMRVYLNHKTYFPFLVKVTHAKYNEQEDSYVHGCAFEKDTINEIALYHFSSFIENVSAYLKTDHGDVLVSNVSKK